MIDIEFSEALAEQARQREAAAARLLDIMDELQTVAREDFADMTEDEFMQMVNEQIHNIRAER